MLTAIIERASGLSCARFLRENIFDPLNRQQTSLELPGAIIPRRASGYSKRPTGWTAADYISMTQPPGGGGMVSSLRDLALWDAALDGRQLLSPSLLRRAHTSYRLADGFSTHYGYGWFTQSYQEHEIIEHAGGIHGYVCQITRLPGTHTLAVVLMNQDRPNIHPDEICFRAVLQANELTFPEPVLVVPDPKMQQEFTGTYELETGAKVSISLKENDSSVHWPGETERIDLKAVGPQEWVDMKRPLYRIYFIKDEAGSVCGYEEKDPYWHAAFIKAKRKNGGSAESY